MELTPIDKSQVGMFEHRLMLIDFTWSDVSGGGLTVWWHAHAGKGFPWFNNSNHKTPMTSSIGTTVGKTTTMFATEWETFPGFHMDDLGLVRRDYYLIDEDVSAHIEMCIAMGRAEHAAAVLQDIWDAWVAHRQLGVGSAAAKHGGVVTHAPATQSGQPVLSSQTGDMT